MTLRISRRTALLGAGALAAGGLAVPAYAQRAPIRIGCVSTLKGPFAIGGLDCFRNVQMELERINYTVAGRRIELLRESSDFEADVAVERARKLIERDNVDMILGPLAGHEGIALRDYSRTLTGKTIVNGSSGSPETTLRDPSPNFFRFNMDGTQWMAGLGNHVFHTMGIREVAIVAGDYAFPYAQVFGFNIEYCRAGGRTTHYWAPLGTTDFDSQIAQINSSNVGAVIVLLGGTDGLTFMTQYALAGGELPLIAGSNTADQAMLSAQGPHRRVMVGMISSGPIANVIDAQSWRDYVERYRHRWLDETGYRFPSIHGTSYSANLTGILTALTAVDGDLSDNQVAFQQALAAATFKAPTGADVRLDHNRHAISDNFINRVEERDGQAQVVAFARVDGVNQTLNMPETAFLALGSPSRENIGCLPAEM
jgi:branched-chain amino acid transport system substrate-binding protein